MAVFNIINGNCYILSHSLPVDEPVNTLTLEHNNKIELEVINSSLGVVNKNIISLINFNPKLLLDLILDKNIDTICFKTNTKIIREKLDIEKNLFKELDFIFALKPFIFLFLLINFFSRALLKTKAIKMSARVRQLCRKDRKKHCSNRLSKCLT